MSRRDVAPPGAEHSKHDPLLIARYAARDVDAADMQVAERIVAECTDCAALVADLRVIARSVAAVPTPRRPRDFRISPEQAAAVRGSFLERILRRIAMPGTAVLQPFAGAAVAIGLVLVVVGGTLPGTSSAPMARAPAPYAAESASSARPGAEVDAGEPGASAVAGDSIGPAASEAAPSPYLGAPELDAESAPLVTEGASPAAAEGAPSDTDPETGEGRASASAEPSDPTPVPSARVSARPTSDTAAVGPDEDTSSGGAAETAAQPDPAGTPLVLVGALLAAAGIVLLLLRVLGQRMMRDPGLR